MNFNERYESSKGEKINGKSFINRWKQYYE